ncbi:protoporphyrinogen oxidase, mitochondrial [Impatiens glandulifera]|uniref:protoporphyrinogen oxidase, mitochondrial n=1 Tax=Impatiens glandulifera TaxID=253017 RepID=UPI001FB1036C|nr:protoporphyrinogen oxidase, mitochondrial [Impatiens glandulifera]
MSPAAEEDDDRSPAKRVAVVGAGVSGLAAAYKLKAHGLDVTIFESEGQAGGKLKSVSKDGLIWDEGANTMTESDYEVSYLLDNLRGLREKQQFPISHKKRYIVRNRVPVLLPTNPIALMKTHFLSVQSKVQIILEPFLWKKNGSISDRNESVGSFFQRHFGKEVVDYIIDPFVAGTSAGDPDSLSIRHAFPELWDLEKRYGSVIVGAIQSKLSMSNKKGKNNRFRGSFSFMGGMQTLVDTLCKEIGEDEFKFHSKVSELTYGSSNWSVSYSPNQNQMKMNPCFDAVIMTAPLGNLKQMKIVKREKPFLLDFIPDVSYLPLSVIITTFKKANVKRPLEGFGVLIPSKEQENGFKSLGTLFSSMMFPGRAHNDEYLYTTFVGGSRNIELAKASRDELKQIVTDDLRQLLGVEGDPGFVSHRYWREAFPLYGRDYDSVLSAIEKMEKSLPGFFYAGNHKEGLSVAKAICSGIKTADIVISYLDFASNKIIKDV